MATTYDFAKGSKVETRDLDSEYMRKQYGAADDLASKHVRVDSKVRQVKLKCTPYRDARLLTLGAVAARSLHARSRGNQKSNSHLYQWAHVRVYSVSTVAVFEASYS